MKYSQIEPITQASAMEALQRDDPAELLKVVISVGMFEEDLPWGQEFCIRF